MRVHTSADEELGLVMVSLHGPPSQRTAEGVRRVLDEAARAGATRVLVDLRELDDVDPATALVLLESDDRFRAGGGWMWLVHGAGKVGSSLRFMGVHDRVRSSPTRRSAGWPAART